MAWFFRGFQPEGCELNEFVGPESFAAFQFRNQAFVERQEFALHEARR